MPVSWRASDAFRALGATPGEAREMYERILTDSVCILREYDATARALRGRFAVLWRD